MRLQLPLHHGLHLRVPWSGCGLRLNALGQTQCAYVSTTSSETVQAVKYTATNATIKPSFWTILSASTKDLLSVRPSGNDVAIKRILPGRIPLLMILFTREHIELMDKEHPFIATTIKRSYRSAQIGQEFDVLLAIVDRIPFPSVCTLQDVPKRQILLSHRSSAGHGGISVATMQSSSVATDFWTNDARPSGRTNMDCGKHSTLSLCFTQVDYGDREVQMPVANTTFVNGKSATLLAQRWINGADPSSPGTLVCTQEKELQNQKVYVTNSEEPNSLGYTTTFNLWLRPITPPRVVSAAIGNIVRQIDVDDIPGQPASQELERSINNEIQSGRLERNTVEVWALLRSQHAATGSLPSTGEIDLSREISRGARLLKVLSGGGGWGHKKGLLALDPDSGYIIANDVTCDFAEGEDMFADIVTRGDTITFFLSDVDIPRKQSEFSGSELGHRNIKLQGQLLEFGCIPSTMDELPDPKRKVENLPLGSNAILIRKYFGMLSEAGMSLKSTLRLPNETCTTSRSANLQAPSSHIRDVSTKLDAPYSLVSFHFKPSAAADELDATSRHYQASSIPQLPALPHVSSEPKTSLGDLETIYRAQKAASRRDATIAARSEMAFTAGDVNSKIEFDDPTKEHNIFRISESEAPPAPQPGEYVWRKFFPIKDKYVPSKTPFDRDRKQNGSMSEDTQRLFEKRSKGASAVEASSAVAQGLEKYEEYSKGQGDNNRNKSFRKIHGIRNRESRLRITKHASISEYGKALERRDGGPIWSRNDSNDLHHEYHLALEDA